jgi:hypothetical protein
MGSGVSWFAPFLFCVEGRNSAQADAAEDGNDKTKRRREHGRRGKQRRSRFLTPQTAFGMTDDRGAREVGGHRSTLEQTDLAAGAVDLDGVAIF